MIEIDFPTIDIEDFTQAEQKELRTIGQDILNIAPHFTHVVDQYFQIILRRYPFEEAAALHNGFQVFQDELISSTRQTIRQIGK